MDRTLQKALTYTNPITWLIIIGFTIGANLAVLIDNITIPTKILNQKKR